jgi:hypothetical protein
VRLSITNTRYQAWHGASFLNPDEALGAELATWLNQGVAPTVPMPPAELLESPGVINDPERTGVDARLSLPPGEPPGTPPGQQSRRASQYEDPPPDPRRQTLPRTRGEVLGAITAALFHLVPGRDDDGRRQRLAFLEACFGRPTMREVAMLADDPLEAGLQQLLAQGADRPTTTQGRRAREPGEEG